MANAVQRFDVALVGFGFSGLATLINLGRIPAQRDIAVIAPDVSGHGLAYGTRERSHLLNVVAKRMGAWAHDPEDFFNWVQTPSGTAACRELSIVPPGRDDFAPRALYARYLTELRGLAVHQIEALGGRIVWIREPAVSIAPAAESGWSIATGQLELRADCCLLAVGNDIRHALGELRHPFLHKGPWELESIDPAHGDGPVVLIGSGLTAIDAVLRLRNVGYSGEVLALSRHGLLPRAHDHSLRSIHFEPEELADIRSLPEVLRFVSGRHAAGLDWREIVDGLRPHTTTLWQRLSPADRRTAISNWSSIWSVHRHRMPPEVGARMADELASGSLRVLSARDIVPQVEGGRLSLVLGSSEGSGQRIRPPAVIDCTGPQLDPRASEQPLLRQLVRSGVCVRHDTGLGFAADRTHQVAPGLYAIGSLLTGELWETIAVPELRRQAATIAEAIADRRAGDGTRPLRVA